MLTVLKFILPVLSISAFADPYQSVRGELGKIQRQFPKTTQVFSLGSNNHGDEIAAIRISTTPSIMNRKKKGHLLVAGVHGNEPRSVDLALSVARSLAIAPRDFEWTIVPVLNIPGYNDRTRMENGFDPNRDFPSICGKATPPQLKSTQRLMALLEERPFVGSIAVHGYAHAMTFPWGIHTNETKTADHIQFEKVTAKAAAINGYPYGTTSDLVYPAENTFEDYAYGKLGIWSLLIELEDGSPRDIKKTTEAVLSYFNGLGNKASQDHTYACITNARVGKAIARIR